jgi:leader peptidase (prepilin peptidase) / N-methyltransferase
MSTGVALVSLGALLLGLALGPILDRLAQWSLREPADVLWRRRPWVTGLLAGGGGAAAVLLVPTPALAPAWVALAWIGAPIVRTDLARHRIPDALNAAAIGAGALLLLVPGDLAAYGRAWLAALAVSGVLLALAIIGPTGLGMGDVKLAPALGLYLGYLGWEAVLVGIFAGFVLGALAAIAILVRDAVARRPLAGALRRSLPFGPFLLLGTLVALAV